MKALSVRHPHAGRIRDKLKSIEVRSKKFPKKYIGVELLICASKRPLAAGWVSGAAQCVVKVVEDRPFTHEDAGAAMIPFVPDQRAWVMEYVRPVDPFPVNGALGFYDVEVPEKIDPDQLLLF